MAKMINPAVAESLKVAAAGVSLIDEVSGDIGERPLGETIDAINEEAAAKVERAVSALIVPLVKEWLVRYGLNEVKLDKDEPFSDSSLSSALSDALDVRVTTIKDKAELKRAFVEAGEGKLSAVTGLNMRGVFGMTRTEARALLLKAAGQRAGNVVPGLSLSDLSSKEQTKADLELFGRTVIANLTGISLSSLRDKNAIKEDLFAWVEGDVRKMLDEERAHEGGRALKLDKKAVKNREAQRRFRAAHGPRESYEKYWPLGWGGYRE